MRKIKKILIFALLVTSYLVTNANAQEEKITITTYYPSPYGSYRELRAQRIAIGDNYTNGTQYCWEGTCTNIINDTADLVVEGNVGIGTTSPQVKLDVNGDIRAEGKIQIKQQNCEWTACVNPTECPVGKYVARVDTAHNGDICQRLYCCVP